MKIDKFKSQAKIGGTKMKTEQLSLPFGQVNQPHKKMHSKSPITLTELKEHGLSQATTHTAQVILELSKRYSNESEPHFGLIQTPIDIYNIFRAELNDYTETTFMLAAVNVKNFITITKALPELPTIRQAMRWAISHSAGGFIICRNNLESFSFTPEEEQFVAEVSKAYSSIGIELLDYVLIGKAGYASARAEGII